MNHKSKNTEETQLRKQILLIKDASTNEDLQYDELIYVLCKRTISIINIAYFIRQTYNNVLPNWQDLPIETIIADKLNLQTMHTERQWQFQNLSKNRFLAKKQRYQKYQSNCVSESKEEIKNRIKVIKDQIVKCEANMNVCKKQQDYLVQLHKYKEFRDELKYWQQKKKGKDVSLDNSTLNSPVVKDISRDHILLKLQSEIQEIKLKSSEKTPINVEKINKRTISERLDRIFKFYTNSNSKVPKFFNDMEKDSQKMSLEAYIKFIKDFSLHYLLNLEQITKVYKKKTKSTRFIEFNDFCETFEDIFKQQCIKRNVQYSDSEYEKYLIIEVVASHKIKQFLKLRLESLNAKSRQAKRRYSNPRQTQQQNDNLNNKIKSKNILDNAGNIKDNILRKLKRFQEEQARKKLNQKRLRQNSQSSQQDQSNRSNLVMKSIQSHIFQKDKNITPTYIKGYKKKKALSQQFLNKIKDEDNYQPQSNKQKLQHKEQLGQLRQIIDQQEDQYLKIHLLPSINHKETNPNINRKVHF